MHARVSYGLLSILMHQSEQCPQTIKITCFIRHSIFSSCIPRDILAVKSMHFYYFQVIPLKSMIIYSLIQMGQQDSKPQPSLKCSPRNITYSLSNSHKAAPSKAIAKRVDCEGVLKLQPTPFKNCIEIQTESQILFLESVELTLKQLLEGRLNTNKLFLAEDIDRLIQGVTYALAYLQQHGVTYKDIDAENIFYDNGNFKLLPNQLICLNTYQKLRDGGCVFPSPELIIALRCGQEEVAEDDIVQKSNVFTFGMILLEVCTLLPSEECYDSQNYDILDAVINERVMLAEEYYGQRVAKIIANMLDYDYTQRMNLKDLSIWVNRQLQTAKSVPQHPHTQQLPHQDAQLSHSVLASNSKIEKNVQRPTGEKSRSRLAKNNSVYMNTQKEDGYTREERNKIYINDREEPRERTFNRQPSREGLNPNRHYRMEDKSNMERERERFSYVNQSISDSDNSYKLNDSLPLRDTRIPEQRQNHPYQLNDDYKPAPPPTSKKENNFERSLLDRDTVTKRIANKQPARPFRMQQGKMPLRQVGNQYYPNIDDILKKGDLIKGPIGENGSLSRIKAEIEKSKKMIEEFKRTEARQI